jgi:PEP-CTERM motif
MSLVSANGATSIDETYPVSPAKAVVGRNVASRKRLLRFLTRVGVLTAGLLLAATPSWATPTTFTLSTAGTLTVDSAGTLTAALALGLPSTGFFDVYTGTYSVSDTNFPTLPITQPYAFALTGSITVDNHVYTYNNTSLPNATAAEANALATNFEDFLASTSGHFFPTLLPNTFYTYNAASDITVAAQTNLATVLPDTGPLSALFSNGTYTISTTGLTLVATPIAAPVPEPASLVLIGSALLGLCVVRRKYSSG